MTIGACIQNRSSHREKLILDSDQCNEDKPINRCDDAIVRMSRLFLRSTRKTDDLRLHLGMLGVKFVHIILYLLLSKDHYMDDADQRKTPTSSSSIDEHVLVPNWV